MANRLFPHLLQLTRPIDARDYPFARPMQTILIALIMVIIVAIGALLIVAPTFERLPIILIYLFNLLVALAIFKSGRPVWAGTIAIFGFWVIATGASMSYIGVYSLSYSAQVIGILSAGIFLTEALVWVNTGLCVGCGLLMVFMARQGIIPTFTDVPLSPESIWVIQSLVFVFAAFIIVFTRRIVIAAFETLSQNQATLKERNQELHNEIEARNRIDQTVQFIAQRGWQLAGDTFLRAIAQYLSESLEMEYVLISELLPRNAERVRSIVYFKHGQFTDNIEYDLDMTPCQNVVGKKLCCYPQGVADLFPADRGLAREAIQCYVGIPLWSSSERPLGIITLMSRRPLVNQARIEMLLQIAAVRTAHELERLRAETQQVELARQTERVEFLRDFMSHMTHDMKTPVSVMKTSLYLLQKQTDEEKRQQHIKSLEQQSDRIGKMIDDILMIARLDSVPALDLRTVNIQNIVGRVLEQLRPKAEEKHIHIDVEWVTNMPNVAGDSDQLQRALSNLVENAIHYTPDKGHITVRGSTDAQNVLLDVADTGIGIKTEDLPYIFDRFYRANNARDFTNGTGLGLVIVKKVVELHGGKIDVTSSVGQGTMVQIHLPYDTRLN